MFSNRDWIRVGWMACLLSSSGPGVWAQATPPTIVKQFVPNAIGIGDTTTLTITIVNEDSGAAQVGVGFSDNLPADLVVATPSGLTSNCGGTATATAGSNVVSLSNGTVPPGVAECSLSVNVQAPSQGVRVNTTSAVTSTNGGTGNAASATLTVGFSAAVPTLSGQSLVALSLLLGGFGWWLLSARIKERGHT